jgi:hypothetical protein
MGIHSNATTIPVPTSSIFIETISATGPKTTMSSGIMVLEVIVKTDNTLLIKACPIVVCNNTIDGVFRSGSDIPNTAIIIP